MTHTDFARSRRGISLIEGVLYLVIALAVIVSGIVFYQQAQLSRRVNETSRMVASLQHQTRGLFSNTDSFGDAPLEAVLIEADVVPDRFVGGGTYDDRLGYNPDEGEDGSGGTGGDGSGGSGDGGSGSDDGTGSDGSDGFVESGTRCEITPDADVCSEGPASDDYCQDNPMDARCAVGGTLANGDTIFGAPAHAPICDVMPAELVPACEADPTANMGEVCASGEEGFLICDHLQFDDLVTRGSSSGADTAYLWNAQSGSGSGDATDAFEIGLVIEHSWGGEVSVYGGTNSFDVTLWELPREACTRLATVNAAGDGPLGTGIAEIHFDDHTESFPDFPIGAAEAEQFCANSENMVSIAYRKRPNATTPVDGLL